MLYYSVSESNLDEAAFATRNEGVDRPTSSKGSKKNEVYVRFRYGMAEGGVYEVSPYTYRFWKYGGC